MKKLMIIAACGLTAACAYAQKYEYRQSQSRMLEPLQEVFVRPLVVDLQVIKEDRQTYTWPFPEVDITKATVGDIANFKVQALYLSAETDGADVIVAPTFDVKSVKKGIEITVKGYPAKYTNWQVATKAEDYEWIEDVYGIKIRTNNSLQAIGDNKAKSEIEK